MSHIDFELFLSREQYLQHYQGSVQLVHVRALDGRTLRFPSRVLQPFVTHEGIRGRFRLHFTPEKRFDRIERLG